MERFQLEILGESISFKSHAGAVRIEEAKAFVEEQYNSLKAHGGQFSREKLLLLLILGVADNLLQSQQALQGTEKRLAALLERIDHTVLRG